MDLTPWWEDQLGEMEVEKVTASWVDDLVDEEKERMSGQPDAIMSDVETAGLVPNCINDEVNQQPDIILPDVESADPTISHATSDLGMRSTIDLSSYPIFKGSRRTDADEFKGWAPKIRPEDEVANIFASRGGVGGANHFELNGPVTIDFPATLEACQRENTTMKAEDKPLDKGKERAKEPETRYLIPDDKDGKPTPGPSRLQRITSAEDSSEKGLDVEEAAERGIHPVDRHQLQLGRYARVQAELAQVNYDDTSASESEPGRNDSPTSRRQSSSATSLPTPPSRSSSASAPSPSSPPSKPAKKQAREAEVTSDLRNDFGKGGLYRMYLKDWQRDGLFARDVEPTEEHRAQLQRWRDRGLELNRKLHRLDPDAQVRARRASKLGAPGTVGRQCMKWLKTFSDQKELLPPTAIALSAWARGISKQWDAMEEARRRKERVQQSRERARKRREARETVNHADDEGEEEEQPAEPAEELQHSEDIRRRDRKDDGDEGGAQEMGFDLSSLGRSLP